MSPCVVRGNTNTYKRYASLLPARSGKTVTIINRSEIVGRPLAAMLANDGATIYSVDVDSIFVFQRGALRKTEATPEEAVGQSDVVVTVSARAAALAFCVFFLHVVHCGCAGGQKYLEETCRQTVTQVTPAQVYTVPPPKPKSIKKKKKHRIGIVSPSSWYHWPRKLKAFCFKPHPPARLAGPCGEVADRPCNFA